MDCIFERLEVRDVPITLQGGEPGLHPDFIEIVQQVSRIHPVDILTNLAFDLDTFVRQVDPAALNRPAPYAPIRVSYHPEQFTLPDLLERVEILVSAGFRVGLYGVLHPDYEAVILEAQRQCIERGLDFRTKPFLGWHQGRLYGEYACPEACAGAPYKTCECAPSELLIAPDGSIHRCHYFLYCQKTALAQIGDPQIILPDDYLACPWLGACNPCDVKIKNNRFQQFGHIAARIRNIH